MAIIVDALMENGVTLSCHVLLKLEVNYEIGLARVSLKSWANEQAYLSGGAAANFWGIDVGQVFLDQGTSVPDVEASLITLAGSPLRGGQRIDGSPADELAAMKKRHRENINQWKLLANKSHFEFRGKRIRYAESDQIEINAVTAVVALRGELPTNDLWPGAWKCDDNTWTPILTVDDWMEFVDAINLRGSVHFDHAQKLKAQVDAAATIEEVLAIQW